MHNKFRAITCDEIRPKFGSSATAKELSYFTEEENKFRDEVRNWVVTEILPHADRIEAEDDKSDNSLAIEISKKACAAGYSNQMVPREYGGGGRNSISETIVAEEVGAASWAVEGVRIPTSIFAGFPLHKFGTEEQRTKYLLPLMLGEKISGMGLTEPGAGSDISRMETSAVKQGDSWVINGEKRFIGNGSTADFLIVYAVTNPDAPFRARITPFLVERDKPEFEVIKVFDHMGWRGTANAWFRLNNYEVSEADIVGDLNNGCRVVMEELDVERIIAAAAGVGIMRSAYEIAVRYSLEREQFGRKISEFEGVSFKLAEMYSKLELSRLLIWKAARQIDAGLSATKEAGLAKWYIGDACVDVSNTAFQVIGGIAYSKDYPIERFMRDSRILSVAGGTNEMQQFILAREILREAKKWPLHHDS